MKKIAINVTLPPQKFITFTIAAFVGCGLAGCGKKAETMAPAVATTNAAPAGAQAENAATVAAQIATTPGAPTVSEPAELNRELRKWILRNRRPPKDFQEFASTAGIQIAPPPDGKKYAINKTMHVILVNR
jgi:hypothetical protein